MLAPQLLLLLLHDIEGLTPQLLLLPLLQYGPWAFT
jgi:hypothetical protein